MSDEPFNEAELHAWLDGHRPGDGETPAEWIAAERDGVSERWDPDILDRDIRALAADYLVLAGNPAHTTTKLREIAQQPPLYAEYVTRSGLAILAQYALYAAAHLDVEKIFGACRWLVSGARHEGIIPNP